MCRFQLDSSTRSFKYKNPLNGKYNIWPVYPNTAQLYRRDDWAQYHRNVADNIYITAVTTNTNLSSL